MTILEAIHHACFESKIEFRIVTKNNQTTFFLGDDICYFALHNNLEEAGKDFLGFLIRMLLEHQARAKVVSNSLEKK